jgi:Glycosyl transferase family 2
MRSVAWEAVARLTRWFSRTAEDLAPRLPHIAALLWTSRRRQEVQLDSLRETVGSLQAGLSQVQDAVARLEPTIARQEALVRAVAAEEPGNRRRLWAARQEPNYPDPFEENEPLVTVALVTRARPVLLLERSLPSILGQSYQRLEVLVMGDDATSAVRSGLAEVHDSRVRFINLTTRVSREPGSLHWLAAKTLPLNEAYGMAQGQWMLEFDDDDALAPTAVEDLLALARHERAEVAYGQFRQHSPDGYLETKGAFPPRFGSFGFSMALVHAGLLFFAREFHAADLGLPGDWYRLERMVRAGVRFAYLPQPVLDYYPSQLWADARPES